MPWPYLTIRQACSPLEHLLLWFLTSVMLQETCMSNAKLLVDFLCIYIYNLFIAIPTDINSFQIWFGWSYHNILKIPQTYSQHITSAAKFLPWSSHGVACPWSRIRGNSSAVVKQTMGRCGFWNHQTNMSTCFNVFQRVSTCFNVFQHVSTCFKVFQRVSTCFNVFQFAHNEYIYIIWVSSRHSYHSIIFLAAPEPANTILDDSSMFHPRRLMCLMIA